MNKLKENIFIGLLLLLGLLSGGGFYYLGTETTLKIVILVLILISILSFTPLSKWSWKKWLNIFIFAELMDVLSTFVAVFVYNNGNWKTTEMNLTVRALAPYFGYDLSVIGIALVIIGLACLVAKFVSKIWPEFVCLFLFFFSLPQLAVAINNFLIPLNIELPLFNLFAT